MKKIGLLVCVSVFVFSLMTVAYGSTEPEFKSFTAKDVNGNTVNESILSGADLTVMNIWGTFCPPCVEEMPDLGEIARAYKGGRVQIIGVVSDVFTDENGNVSAQELAEAKRIIKETNADYLHLLPSEDLSRIKLDSLISIPETVFIDKTGRIIHSVLGSNSKSEWEKIIETVLAKVK